MLGRILARISVIFLLIALAHAIKPFTVKNITSHLLYSSRSLAFILPDSMRSRFDRANQLALSLSNSIFSDKRTGWPKKTIADSAVAGKSEMLADITEFEAESAVKMESNTLKQKRNPAIRGVASKMAPVVLPSAREFPLVFRFSFECSLIKKLHPFSFQIAPQRIRIMYQPKSDCDKRLFKQISMATFFEAARKRRKADLLECEENAAAEPLEDDNSTEIINFPAEYAQPSDNCTIP
ncbi:MAG: hypothetical protein J2P41_09140 [Blastocatellia bacterium]|nr:hypothetical protein [Blastocatellia bacterium]